MEFVSNLEDMLGVAGEVFPLGYDQGIQMALPQQVDDKEPFPAVYKIVFGITQSGKRYLETMSTREGVWPVYGEASIPEILVFARKALHDMPNSPRTTELVHLAVRIEEVLRLL